MNYSSQLSDIKRLLLTKFKITSITPGDCEHIAQQINKNTQRPVSITTIKRLFGLAFQKYKFSDFTLVTLSEFLNISYIKQAKTSDTNERAEIWSTIRSKALSITKDTLLALDHVANDRKMDKISSKFDDIDFKFFYNSDYIFTNLVASEECKKSCILCHLANKLFLESTALYHKSTLLMINANDLFNTHEDDFDAEDRIKLLLDPNTDGNMFDYLNCGHQNYGGKIVIILANFNDVLLTRWSYDQLFNTLKSILYSLKYSKNIKLVFYMNYSMWILFYTKVNHSDFLKSKWFPGYYHPIHEFSGIKLQVD